MRRPAFQRPLLGRTADASAAAERMPCLLRAGGVAGRGGRALALRALGGRPAARVHGLPARRARAHQAAGGGRRGGGGGRGRRRAAGPGCRAADAPAPAQVRPRTTNLNLLRFMRINDRAVLLPLCLHQLRPRLTCRIRCPTSRHAGQRMSGATPYMLARAKDASWPCVQCRQRIGG